MSEKTTLLLMIAMLLVLVLLIIQSAFIRMNRKKGESNLDVLKALADIYYSLHLIDLESLGVTVYESNDLMRSLIAGLDNAKQMMDKVINETITSEYLEVALEFTDIYTLRDRMKDKQIIFMDMLGKNVGWVRMSFIKITSDINGYPQKVIVATQVIDEEKRREEELTNKANGDELTGLYNRRAYEDDMVKYAGVPHIEDFVYLTVDVNGLKATNDTLGHIAGDELIVGAANCLKTTVGNYGKVYRTGGDEFVAAFFAEEVRLPEIIRDLHIHATEWKGEYSDNLSFSVGFATKREFPAETLIELSQIADKRMYEEKERYYSQKGIDRRSQAAAHTALCNLFTKILKINLTKDSFAIVKMDTAERTRDMGFSTVISEWLYGFGKSGQVHEDDLDRYLQQTNIEYLKNYFKSGEKSICINYRRKAGDKYENAEMQIIRAEDYSDSNQSLFLYVKSF